MAFAFHELAPSKIVSMIEFKGRVFVATETQCFELHDHVFMPVSFARRPQPIQLSDTSRPEGT